MNSLVEIVKFSLDPIVNYDFDEAFKKFVLHFQGTKSKMYTHRYRELSANGYHISKKRLNVCKCKIKCDEAIVKNDASEVGYTTTFKPRIVQAIDVDIQVLLGPFLNEVAEYLKFRRFTVNCEPIIFEGENFYWFYAPGQTVDRISEWFNFALTTPGIHIAAAGDDTLIVVNRNGVVTFFEGDARSFDSTESIGPLSVELDILRHFGMPNCQLKILNSSFSSTLVISYSTKELKMFKMIIDRLKRPTRNTGGPDTTFGNTMVILISSTFSYAGTDDLNVIASRYAYLGLDMKLKKFNDPHMVTFLKGFFIRDIISNTQKIDYFHWCPLPSRIIKIPKSLTRPTKIYKITDEEKAAKFFMNDVCYGLNTMTLEPILEIFTNQFIFTERIRKLEVDWFYMFTEGSVKHTLSPADAEEATCKRYNLNVEEYRSFLIFLRGIKMFCFVSHPILTKMVQKDYS